MKSSHQTFLGAKKPSKSSPEIALTLTEEILRRCIENEGTKNWTQKRVFLDVYASCAILHSRWITCYEAQN